MPSPVFVKHWTSIESFQTQVGNWSRYNFDKQPPYIPLLGVVEEVGELCHTYVKMIQGIRQGEDQTAKAKDAVGDIVIFLADFCERSGLDLESCIRDTWQLVQKRDWKTYPQNGVDK